MGDHDVCPSCGGQSLDPPREGCTTPEWSHAAPEPSEEAGEHDDLFGFGRWARAERTMDQEAFQGLLHRLDVESALTDFDDPPGAYEVYNELTVTFKWSEIFRYADGVQDHMISMDADPIGYAIDAYLEPRYEADENQIVKRVCRVEYAEDVDTEIFRMERERKVEEDPDVQGPAV